MLSRWRLAWGRLATKKAASGDGGLERETWQLPFIAAVDRAGGNNGA
jgi:hypothetical protein